MNFVKLSPKIKIYLKTFGLLGALIIIAIVVLKLATTQIPLQKNKLAEQLKKEQALRLKSELLATIETEAQSQAQLLSFALPSQNASFMALSQIRLLAGTNLILITNLKIGSETKDGAISSADLSFDAEGALPSILTFLEDLNTVAPLISLGKVQINQTPSVARATLAVKAYWAELPKAIPKITEPIKDLTNEEKEIVVKILGLTPPEFVLLDPQGPRENLNPF